MIKNIQDASCAFLRNIDLVCFSHLRWSFVFQRPQHLLSRFAKHTRVFFIEEPIWHDGEDKLQITESDKNVFVVVPYIKNGTSKAKRIKKQKEMVQSLLDSKEINRYFSWYYTPMALEFSNHLSPELIVYDCMDELSALKNAPAELKENEKELIRKADVVFTGGNSIYEAKKNCHSNIYSFPSSIEKEHFAKGRKKVKDPADQANIPHPRFGFFGVIDERMDIDLIREVAAAKPEWHFVIIGPVVKIDPQTLPMHSNINYVGGKSYQELPSYIANWDVAMIPFVLNESTKFISPTKTPEYLAAGKQVISTPIRDVIHPYGENKLVHIASNAQEFIKHGETALKNKKNKAWLSKVDDFLEGNSWEKTWSQMVRQIETILQTNKSPKLQESLYV